MRTTYTNLPLLIFLTANAIAFSIASITLHISSYSWFCGFQCGIVLALWARRWVARHGHTYIDITITHGRRN